MQALRILMMAEFSSKCCRIGGNPGGKREQGCSKEGRSECFNDSNVHIPIVLMFIIIKMSDVDHVIP